MSCFDFSYSLLSKVVNLTEAKTHGKVTAKEEKTSKFTRWATETTFRKILK